MQRYKQPSFDVHPDGEWIRYEDHVEAMKRIAGDGAQQAEPVAWVRLGEDGELRNEFIWDAAIEPARKQCGQWLPLVIAAPASSASVRKCTRCEYIGRCDCEPTASPDALTREDRKRIARDVQVQCSLIPGASFYNAAEMAIDAFNEASPAKPVYDCSTTDCQCDACMIERGEAGPFNDVEDRAPSASPEALTDAQTRAQLESLARHSYGGRFPV